MYTLHTRCTNNCLYLSPCFFNVSFLSFQLIIEAVEHNKGGSGGKRLVFIENPKTINIMNVRRQLINSVNVPSIVMAF